MTTRAYKGSVLHETLARAFESSSLTQGEIADLLGVTQQTVSDWIRGVTRPSLSRFPEIEHVLNLDEGALYAASTVTVRPEPVHVATSLGQPTTTVASPRQSRLAALSGRLDHMTDEDLARVEGYMDAILDQQTGHGRRP